MSGQTHVSARWERHTSGRPLGSTHVGAPFGIDTRVDPYNHPSGQTHVSALWERHTSGQTHVSARMDRHTGRSLQQFPLKRLVQHGRQQRVEFRLRLRLQRLQRINLGLQAVEVSHDAALFFEG